MPENENSSVTDAAFWAQEACAPYWIVLVTIAVVAVGAFVVRGIISGTDKLRLRIISGLLAGFVTIKAVGFLLASGIAEAVGRSDVAERLSGDSFVWTDAAVLCITFVLACTDFVLNYREESQEHLLSDIRFAKRNPGLPPDQVPEEIGQARYQRALTVLAVAK